MTRVQVSLHRPLQAGIDLLDVFRSASFPRKADSSGVPAFRTAMTQVRWRSEPLGAHPRRSAEKPAISPVVVLEEGQDILLVHVTAISSGDSTCCTSDREC